MFSKFGKKFIGLCIYLGASSVFAVNVQFSADATRFQSTVTTNASTEDFSGGAVVGVGTSFANSSVTATNGSSTIDIQDWGSSDYRGDGNLLSVSGTSGTTSLTLELNTPSKYLGFFWIAGDAGNHIEIFGSTTGLPVDATSLATFNTSDLSVTQPTPLYFNPVSGKYSLNAPYAYVDIQLDDPSYYITKVVISQDNGTGGFELDNFTTSTTYNATPGLATQNDETAPQVTSITRQSPSTSPTANDTVTWRVTFNEAVQNVGAADFGVAGTTATLSVTQVSASVYDVTVSGGDLADLNGTVTLSFASAQDVSDLAGNALSATTPTGTNDNTYLISNDATAPTLTITAVNGGGAVVANGAATYDETLTVSFTLSEAAGSDGLEVGDIAVANGALSGFSCTGLICTATLTPTNAGLVTIEVAAGKFNDAAGNNNTAATPFTWTYGVDPTKDPDVVGGIQAMQEMGLRFVNTSLKAVNTRIEWLRNHPEASGRSHQGIKLTFADPLVEKLVNGNGQGFKPFNTADAAKWAQRAGSNPKGVTSDVESFVTDGLLAEAKKASGLNLNPTGGPVMGGWSVWTEGQIQIGKNKAAEQESQIYGITVGMDKPREQGVMGLAATIGKGDVDIGTAGSKMGSEYLSLSAYSAFEPKNMPLMEAVFGVGKMRVDSTRIAGAQTLRGTRNTDSVFGSYKVHGKDFKRGSLTLKPYGAVEATHIALKGYTESGGKFALVYGEQSVRQTTLMLGLDINYEQSFKGGKLRPFTKAEVGFDHRKTSGADLHYVGDLTNYRLGLSTESDRYVMIRVGADYDVRADLSASFSVEHTATDKSGFSNGIRAKLSWRF